MKFQTLSPCIPHSFIAGAAPVGSRTLATNDGEIIVFPPRLGTMVLACDLKSSDGQTIHAGSAITLLQGSWASRAQDGPFVWEVYNAHANTKDLSKAVLQASKAASN